MVYSLNHENWLEFKSDEVKCPIHRLGDIYKVLKESNNSELFRLVIIYYEDNGMSDKKKQEELALVQKITSNYTVAVNTLHDLSIMLESRHPAFVNYPVADWETFEGLMTKKVSDIWIDGALGFSVPQVKKKLNGNNIKIRICPQKSVNASLITKKASNIFFVRPEDVYDYNAWVDIIDFQEPSKDKEVSLYRVYALDKRWPYDIDLLIPQTLKDIPNGYIGNNFVMYRLNCEQKCRIPGHTCHACEMDMAMATITERKVRTDNGN